MTAQTVEMEADCDVWTTGGASVTSHSNADILHMPFNDKEAGQEYIRVSILRAYLQSTMTSSSQWPVCCESTGRIGQFGTFTAFFRELSQKV